MMKSHWFFKSQAGQAELLGLIIAGVIGAIVIAGTTESFIQLQRGQNNIIQTAEAIDIKREVESVLSNANVCRTAMAGKVADGTTYTQGFDNPGTATNPDIPINAPILGSTAVIRQWSLTAGTTIRNDGTNPARSVVVLNLIIEKRAANGPRDAVRQVKLLATHTGAIGTAIDECYTLTGTANDLWLRDNSGNNIFNTNPGNVGIGTGTTVIPAAKLHVFGGDMRVSGQLQANDFEAVSLNNAQFMSVGQRTGFGVANPAVELDVNGNAIFNGDLTVGQTLSSGSLIIQQDLSVGGNLTNDGPTTLNVMNVSGASQYLSTSQFIGPATFGATVTMTDTLSIRGGSLIGNDKISVNGSAVFTNDVETLGRVNANRFCIAGNCKTTFATQTCPNGTVLWRKSVSGEISPSDCKDISCPVGTFFQGLDGSTNKICLSLPTPTCPTNSYIDAYDAVTGYSCQQIPPQVQVTTCPANTYLTSVGGGAPVCLPVSLIGGSCGLGRAVTDINPDGSPVCENAFTLAAVCPLAQPVMYGLQSDGRPLCRAFAIGGICSGAGTLLTSLNGNGSINCGSVSVTGGSCANGVLGISSGGVVICR